MTYRYLTWLDDVLRAAGLAVDPVGGWEGAGRPSSTGAFDPFGVLIHHTGATSSSARPAPSLNTCIYGRDDLPGPLCQLLIAYDGHVHLIAAGRANHAGQARASGPMPAGDGNAFYVGIECDYDGTQRMSAVQYDTMVAAAAAIIGEFGVGADHVRGHKETSTTGKWDPGGYEMNDIRSDIANYGEPDGEDTEDMWMIKDASTGGIFVIIGDQVTHITDYDDVRALQAGGVKGPIAVSHTLASNLQTGKD